MVLFPFPCSPHPNCQSPQILPQTISHPHLLILTSITLMWELRLGFPSLWSVIPLRPSGLEQYGKIICTILFN